ncbi:hypothetical protein AVEN_171730-1 [Araneus ventricosus]|uniref:Uncharacterized protein n=1 Tax=Araneus ventricosus TaxID=182803 RepID=A0A4Y2LMQ9_ARAVE|nr:hypothetical protein AVEN_171730-1 [Araneus ventricosus]
MSSPEWLLSTSLDSRLYRTETNFKGTNRFDNIRPKTEQQTPVHIPISSPLPNSPVISHSGLWGAVFQRDKNRYCLLPAFHFSKEPVFPPLTKKNLQLVDSDSSFATALPLNHNIVTSCAGAKNNIKRVRKPPTLIVTIIYSRTSRTAVKSFDRPRKKGKKERTSKRFWSESIARCL